jgi:hypothetical protein
MGENLMVPSESAPQELSNEWSCQYVSTILNFLGNFCVPHPAATYPQNIESFGAVVFFAMCRIWTDGERDDNTPSME